MSEIEGGVLSENKGVFLSETERVGPENEGVFLSGTEDKNCLLSCYKRWKSY